MIFETDILIEPDLKISSGDLNIGAATNENIKYLLIANPGQFLISPTIGMGLYNYQNSAISDSRKLVNDITNQLRTDGYANIRISGEYNDQTQSTDLTVTADRNNKPARMRI